ncbi:FkbM family methyltransferase [uncultured Ruminococcus sp.]|uniref:FkbM family methyltransferase n=1 Tax=uncultured Ruminococcus sp. TaxID=165186 RepID=UPI0029316C5E|nr:FkbM family methyltransferase [uncultured Ruminococcus sp.]
MMHKLFIFEAPDVWTTLAQADKPIILYGMGNGADKVLDELEKRHIKAAGVMASDDFCRYQEYRGFTVQKQRDFEEQFRLLGYASNIDTIPQSPFGDSSLSQREPNDFIIALCFGSSLPDVMAHIRHVAEQHKLLVPNIPVAGESIMDDRFIAQYRQEIKHAYSLLADEQSRKVFKGALDFYYTGELKYLDMIESDKDEVFANILRLREERYLDLGAYRGDTVDEFLHYTDGYQSIIAVEPNPKNYKKLCEHIADIGNATALHAGIAGRAGTMTISKKAGRMPVLGDTNGVEIPVTTVDTIDCSPTYIKIDIEGMEPQMLSGAEHTLRTLKPKLNLAAYHRTEDFFLLILQLHEINPDYRIYLRKHPYIPCWDLNIYAV